MCIRTILYGYEMTDGKLAICQSEASVVREVYDRYTSALIVLLFVTENTPMAILQGIAFFHVLLFASVQDISTHEADDSLWVMLLILAIPNMETVGLLSMAFAGGMLFLPQLIVSMICKNPIGGADIKISTAAAVFLGVTRGLVGFIIGLTLAVTENPTELATFDENKAETLRQVFWDMNRIQIHTEVVDEVRITTFVDEKGNVSTVETVVEIMYLYVNTEMTSIVKLCEIYGFTELQREMLAELLSDENDRMWGGAQFAE